MQWCDNLKSLPLYPSSVKFKGWQQEEGLGIVHHIYSQSSFILFHTIPKELKGFSVFCCSTFNCAQNIIKAKKCVWVLNGTLSLKQYPPFNEPSSNHLGLILAPFIISRSRVSVEVTSHHHNVSETKSSNTNILVFEIIQNHGNIVDWFSVFGVVCQCALKLKTKLSVTQRKQFNHQFPSSPSGTGICLYPVTCWDFKSTEVRWRDLQQQIFISDLTQSDKAPFLNLTSETETNVDQTTSVVHLEPRLQSCINVKLCSPSLAFEINLCVVTDVVLTEVTCVTVWTIRTLGYGCFELDE